MNKQLIHSLALTLMVAVLSPSLAASGPESLTQEQRQELRALRDRMEDEGASPEAMRAAHDKLFLSWGLEAPPMRGGRGPCGAGMGPRDGEGPRLSQEQRQELRAMRDRMEDEGAGPEAVRAAHDKLFQGWGLEAPPMRGGRGPCGAGMGPRGGDGPREGEGPRLSQEQRQELRALRDRMEDEGASPEACRAAHDKLFESWGLEAPPMPGGRGPCGKAAKTAKGAKASTSDSGK